MTPGAEQNHPRTSEFIWGLEGMAIQPMIRQQTLAGALSD